MLCANTMPRSHDAAFQERERGFDGVSVNIAYGIDAVLVANRLVLCEYASIMQGFWVALKLIGHNHVNVLRDVLADVLRQRSRLHVLGMEEAQRSATLTD